jgi:hypothetical protein
MDAKNQTSDKVLLKSNRMAAAAYDLWLKTNNKALIIAEMSKVYAVFLSLEQVDALIKKGKEINKLPE